MDTFQLIVTIAGGVITLTTLITLVVKPLRNAFINSIGAKTERKTILQDIRDIKEAQTKMLENDERIDQSVSEMNKRIDKLEQRVLDNELSRLKTDLFDCGSRCRRGLYLHPEEMEHIRDVYTKYHSLNGNGPGTLEYEFIVEYYNRQSLNNQ